MSDAPTGPRRSHTCPQFRRREGDYTNAVVAAKAALGEAYASYGKIDKAIALYKGACGSSFAEAHLIRLHPGQAYLVKGDPAAATKAFLFVKDPKFAELADLWIKTPTFPGSEVCRGRRYLQTAGLLP